MLKGLYAILDRSIVKGDDWEGSASALLRGGAVVLQLRAKNKSAGRLLEFARAMSRLCKESGAMFVMNDHADVARAAGAALHIGQDDLPLEAARAFMGKNAVIGVSTHSMNQAKRAERGGADYIAFGPIYSTSTKPDALAPRGVEELKEIVEAVKIPVVAIGGIGPGTISEIRAAGASSAAVISALGKNDELEKNARELSAAWEETLK